MIKIKINNNKKEKKTTEKQRKTTGYKVAKWILKNMKKINN